MGMGGPRGAQRGLRSGAEGRGDYQGSGVFRSELTSTQKRKVERKKSDAKKVARGEATYGERRWRERERREVARNPWGDY